MMKLIILLSIIVIAASAPQSDVTILKSENDNKGDGEYNWAFETSDNTKQEQKGSLRAGKLEDGTDGQYEVVEGSYSYVAPDGRTITVTYTSDEKGYRAKTTYT